MVRIIVGSLAGLVGWLVLWITGEKCLSAVAPGGFGAHQLAFEDALVNGGPFTANTAHLVMHVALGTTVSLAAGFLSVRVAGGNQRTPLVLGFLLLALGLMKAMMSWTLVPTWYHVLFTALLFPLAILGGRLGRTRD